MTAWSLLDVGPTPYYLSVFNESTNTLLARCATGTQCTAPAPPLPPPNTCYTYGAFISSYPTKLPLSNVQRTSATLLLCGLFIR